MLIPENKINQQCTLWMVESLTRAGVYERSDYLERAVNMVSEVWG
jgi:hypothetical protein